jgi:septum site-determining protein MinC
MNIENSQLISIKGIREGLLITIGIGEWQDILEELLGQIDNQEGFFKSAKVALDVGELSLRAADLGVLREKLADREIMLWAVLSSSVKTEQNAQALGLATRIFTPRPEREIKTISTSFEEGENAIILQRTLRSGFRVSFQGSVVVVGDVNPGADIIAGGSVVVWGKLRGTVHAGSDGDEQAVVCALEMEPVQLRIANAVLPIANAKRKSQPEVIKILNGQVVVEPWIYK